jgi:hypothetical protein
MNFFAEIIKLSTHGLEKYIFLLHLIKVLIDIIVVLNG